MFDTELSRYVQTLEQDQKLASEAKDHLEEQLHTKNREALRYYKVAKVDVRCIAGISVCIYVYIHVTMLIFFRKGGQEEEDIYES